VIGISLLGTIHQVEGKAVNYALKEFEGAEYEKIRKL
jgi:hypothetical protein